MELKRQYLRPIWSGLCLNVWRRCRQQCSQRYSPHHLTIYFVTHNHTQSTAERDEHIVKVTEWSQFVPALDGKNITLCAWCDTTACEDGVKKKSTDESLKATGEENIGFRLTGMPHTLSRLSHYSSLPTPSFSPSSSLLNISLVRFITLL